MVAKDSPERLPSGWTVQFRALKSGRQVRIYTNTEIGKKFFSKDKFLQFINGGSSCSSEPQTSNGHVRCQEERTASQAVNEKDQLHEWLPKGWKVEVRARKSGTHIGKEYKTYIDPLNGSKFYSKLEVLRHLKNVGHRSCIARDALSVKGKNITFKKKTGISMPSADKVAVQKCKDEDLPSGWIKEIKIRTSSNGIRKDPFYKDPVSGYVFRSKRDALRYIETGEISKSATRPKELRSSAPELMMDEIAPSSAAKRQKLKHPASKRQLFAGKMESQMSELEPSKNEGPNISSAKRVSPEARVTAASRDETVQGKHPLNDVIQECLETKEKCSSSRSSPKKDKGSRRGGDKRAQHSDAGLSEKSRVKNDLVENGPVSPPTPGNLQDKNFLETATEKSSIGDVQVDSRKSKANKVHNSPEKSKGKGDLAKNCSVSTPTGTLQEKNCLETATEKSRTRDAQINSRKFKDKVHNGPEKSGDEKDLAENGPVSTPTPDNLQDKNGLGTALVKSSTGDGQINSRKSKDKKVHNLPPRSSKRLAGNEPDLVVNLDLGERALITAVRKSRKTEAIRDTVLASDGLVHSSFVQLQNKSETELVDNASTDTKNPLEGDPSNKSTVPLEEQVVQEELQQKIETENVHDNPEPQLSFLFGSDPCLEFAFKTLIGELPLDDTSVKEPSITHAAGTLQHENLLDSGMKNSSTGKAGLSKSKSKNKKELNLPRRSSKRLARVESELEANPVASERALQGVSRKPYDNGTISDTKFLDRENQPLGAGPKIELHNRLSTKTDASIPESSYRRENFLEDFAATSQGKEPVPETEMAEREKPESAPQMHQTGNTALKKPEPAVQMHESDKEELGMPEPDVPFSIADYWSDPCLDFAFKTLTGVIPIEETLVQGCFQEQIDVPDNDKNGNAALPDFGSCSLFQTDVSAQFDAPEKSASSQQLGGTSSFLPPPKVSLPSCSGSHSQQQPSLEGNKDLQPKVKS